MTMMRISQLAERSGVPASTLRFYEGAGLLPAARTEAGYRVYGQDAAERLDFIAAAKHLGLPLSEIKDLLEVWQAGSCAQVKADLRPRITARLAQAGQRAAELAALSATLHGALEHLDALPDRAGRCDPGCGFLAEGPGAQRRGETARAIESPSVRDAASGAGERWRTAPVACSLAPADVPGRAATWRDVLKGSTARRIPEGIALTLPACRAATVAGLAAAEQECCPFFDFRLHLDGQHLHLEVRAPAAALGQLAELFTPAVD